MMRCFSQGAGYIFYIYEKIFKFFLCSNVQFLYFFKLVVLNLQAGVEGASPTVSTTAVEKFLEMKARTWVSFGAGQGALSSSSLLRPQAHP